MQVARPCPLLRPYVRSYAQRRVDSGSATICEAVPPRLEQTVEFQFQDPFIVALQDGRRIRSPRSVILGLQTRRSDILLAGSIESFGIFFEPTGFSRLFRVPTGELSNRFFEAETVLGKSVALVAERLAETTFPGRVRIVEEFLVTAALKNPPEDSIVRAAQRLFAERGCMAITELAWDCALGIRQFERRFLKTIGLSPKLYARLARFQTALDAKVERPDLDWLYIAHELGYHDQMHMIHDFKNLAGGTPSILFRQLGDARPPAFAENSAADFVW
jgi:AraC-like DNA-binding protein